jgi:FdhD protein
VTRIKPGGREKGSLDLIEEEPLMIRIDDKPYSVVMRTPGDERFHAAGFCLGEGVADAPDDFQTLGYDEQLNPNVIDVWLTPGRRAKVQEVLDRRLFVSQTSCGICGKEMVRDLQQDLAPVESDFAIGPGRASDCLAKLEENQKHYKATRGSHAALVLDDRLEPISFAEDVGRHNALDKAIGEAFMNRKLATARVVVLSSRNSYELVQKTARAGIPVMISYSRPTALAVEMGKALNLTLAFSIHSDLVVVCGEDRIR